MPSCLAAWPPLTINRNKINHLQDDRQATRLNASLPSLYLPRADLRPRRRGPVLRSRVFRWARDILHSCCAGKSVECRGVRADHRERLSEARGWWIYSACSVDARRNADRRDLRARARTSPRSATPSATCLTSPVRDAPPIARETPRDVPLRRARPGKRRLAPRQEASRPRTAKTNGATAPRLTKRAGYLAVHSVEKSFGSPTGGARRQHLCPPRRGGRACSGRTAPARPRCST